jgi:hypothetical protein
MASVKMGVSQSITYDIPPKCLLTFHSEMTGHIVMSCTASHQTHIIRHGVTKHA